MDNNLEVIMGLIVNAGDAKSHAMEAIREAKTGNIEEAYQKIRNADKALVEAHHSRTSLLSEEARGNHIEISLLMVHSQDHLMTAIAFKDLAKEIIDLYKSISKI